MRYLTLLKLVPQLFGLLFLTSAEGGTGGTGSKNTGDNSGTGGNTGATGDTGGGGAPKITGDFDPDRAARAIEAARAGEKTEREKRQKAESQTAAVLKALGLGGDGKPDPEKVAAELESERATARQAKIDLEVYKRSGDLGADAAAVLDSRSFASKVADLDPTSGSFGASVEKAIKEALEANSKLKAAGAEGDGKEQDGKTKDGKKQDEKTKEPAARRSGGQFQGGGGTDKEPEPVSTRDRLRRAYASAGSDN